MMNQTESKQIAYKSGYKHQTDKDHWFFTGITGYEYANRFLILSADGWLLIKAGYAWDGASGPTWDTLSTMRASLLHDALYQLIIEDAIPMGLRLDADDHLYRLMIEDGAFKFRAKVWLWAVNKFGDDYMGNGSGREVHTAP